MNKLGRAPFLTIWFYVSIGALITWQEYYTPITKEDYFTLLTYRIFILGSAIPIAYILRKNPFSLWANSFICLNFLAYSMVGHFYRPLYYACFIQTLFAFSFLFFTTRRLYFVLTTIKSIAFGLFYLWSYDLVKYAHGAETKLDFLATIFVAWALGILIHHIFTAERGLKEAANERFALLGRHAATIIHDVKGTLSIPYLFVEEAKRSVSERNFDLAKEHLDQIAASLKQSEKVIFDLNSLSSLTERGETNFNVRKSVDDILELLSKRLHDVDISVSGDFVLNADKSIFSSVFLNLIVNSLDNFRRSRIQYPFIKIEILEKDRTIEIADNAGGFSKDALLAIKSGAAIPEKISQSGLGLFLVKENLRAIGGMIKFENDSLGAKVRITFN